jgi:hypothetical protein
VVDIIVKVLTPADTYDLLSLDELKTGLGIQLTDTTQDAQLQQLITTYSDVIATTCNRVFAKETVQETVRELQPDRYFLTHYPLSDETDVESVETPRGTVVDPSTYEIELGSGKVELVTSGQSEPIVFTYTGGYALPDEAPPALKQACILAIRQERMLANWFNYGGIRALTHKESRVVYYDPMMMLKSLGMGGVATVNNNLLMHYVRIQV